MISVVAEPRSKRQIISQTRNEGNPFTPQGQKEVLMLTTAYKSVTNTNRTLNNEEIRQLKNPTNFSKHH
jgi:hypothetical protein